MDKRRADVCFFLIATFFTSAFFAGGVMICTTQRLSSSSNGYQRKALVERSTKNDPRVNRVRKCHGFFRSKAHATLGFVTSVANFGIYIGELIVFSNEKMERLKH